MILSRRASWGLTGFIERREAFNPEDDSGAMSGEEPPAPRDFGGLVRFSGRSVKGRNGRNMDFFPPLAAYTAIMKQLRAHRNCHVTGGGMRTA